MTEAQAMPWLVLIVISLLVWCVFAVVGGMRNPPPPSDAEDDLWWYDEVEEVR